MVLLKAVFTLENICDRPITMPNKRSTAVLVGEASGSVQITGACNAVLVKPNQAGTLTETRAALDAAR